VSRDGPTLRVGNTLPDLTLPPLTRGDLARYADASGDHAAVHLDDDYARAVGFPGVIAHGLLVMSYLGRVLSDWQPVDRLRGFSCRFVAVTLLGERLRCSGRIVALRQLGDEELADLELAVHNEVAELKLTGRATVALQETRA